MDEEGPIIVDLEMDEEVLPVRRHVIEVVEWKCGRWIHSYDVAWYETLYLLLMAGF